MALDQHQTQCNHCSESLFIFDYGLETPSEDEARQLAKNLSWNLFHQECKRCIDLGLSYDSNAQSLCDFCRHLRLSHLFRCVDLEKWKLGDTFIKLCRFEDLEVKKQRDGSMSSCSFCSLIIQSVLPYRYFTGVGDTAELQGGVVCFSVGKEYISTRLEYPDALTWRGGKRVTCVDTLAISDQRTDKGDAGSSPPPPPGAPNSETWVNRRRKPKKATGERINWDLTSYWLAECHQNHEMCAQTDNVPEALPGSFRVIDIRRRCIVKAPPNCTFVALSYVWGANPDPTKLFATKSNIESLRVNGSLSPSQLPLTVEDATQVCAKLGEAYLWVDRFCIIQDDLVDKAEQITAMAAIYSLAKFVICVADGNSDSGIAGVSHDRLCRQQNSRIADMTFTTEAAGWRDVITDSQCIWSTRGWTYQEAILPRRKLYLTEAQAFFSCGEQIRSEDGSDQASMYSAHQLRARPWEPLVDTFYGHVYHYRTRKLTNISDMYNAIDGVASALYGNFGSLWEGLPRGDFDKALLWCPDWSTESRPGRFHNDDDDNKFPSWSWSSTSSAVDMTLLDDCNRRNITYHDTLVPWACRNPSAGVVAESVETAGGIPLSNLGDEKCKMCADDNDRMLDSLLYTAIAWSLGLVDQPYPFERDMTFGSLRELAKKRWGCHHGYWRDALLPSAPKVDSQDSSHATFAPAQSAFFRLRGSVQRSGDRLGDLCIVDQHGKPAGLLVVQHLGLGLDSDGIAGRDFEFIALSVGDTSQVVLSNGNLRAIWESDLKSLSPSVEEEGAAWVAAEDGDEAEAEAEDEDEISSTDEPPDGATDLLLATYGGGADLDEPEVRSNVSEEDWPVAAQLNPGARSVSPSGEARSGRDSDSDADDEEIDIKELTVWDSQGKALFPLPMVNVMMVERTPENPLVARRISVGWIYLMSWAKSQPSFGMVWLQ